MLTLSFILASSYLSWFARWWPVCWWGHSEHGRTMVNPIILHVHVGHPKHVLYTSNFVFLPEYFFMSATLYYFASLEICIVKSKLQWSTLRCVLKVWHWFPLLVDLFLGIKEGGKVMGDANSATNMHGYYYISVYKLEIESASKKNDS